MGSAKTAILLTTAYNFEERGMAYMCIKPATDTREKRNVIRSRIGIERECTMISQDTDLYRMFSDMAESGATLPEWVLVDEAQFLSAIQVDQLSMAVDNFHINVICCGLRTDFRTRLFEGSRRLFEIADSIDEIKSTCSCGRKTVVNARIDSTGLIVTQGRQVEIGGNDRYVSLCRKCWRERRLSKDSLSRLPFNS